MPNNTCYIYVVFVHMLNIMQVHTADQNFWLVIDFHLLCYLSESPNCVPLSCVRSFGLFDLFAWTACIWCSFAKSFGLCCLRIAMISLRIVRTISLTIFIITRVSSHCHNHNQSISFILERQAPGLNIMKHGYDIVNRTKIEMLPPLLLLLLFQIQ